MWADLNTAIILGTKTTTQRPFKGGVKTLLDCIYITLSYLNGEGALNHLSGLQV